jgi:hypothetical protein
MSEMDGCDSLSRAVFDRFAVPLLGWCWWDRELDHSGTGLGPFYRSCVDLASILRRSCVDFASILCRFSVDFASILCRFCVDSLSILRRFSVDFAPILRRFSVDAIDRTLSGWTLLFAMGKHTSEEFLYGRKHSRISKCRKTRSKTGVQTGPKRGPDQHPKSRKHRYTGKYSNGRTPKSRSKTPLN